MQRFLSVILILLEKISSKVWQSNLYRFLFLLLATLVTVCLMGYHFGSFDQVVHIPFLKKYADPTLYPNDAFLDLRQYHYSFFWFFFIPFYKLGILEVSMFVTYVCITYMTFWAFWRLSKTLFNNPVVSFLTILVLTTPHVGFAAFAVFEFSLLNRTFVLPFLLIAIDLYLKRRFIFSFLILGLMYNLHVISVNFVLFMFLFDTLLQIKKIEFKRLMLNLAVFILTALPVLLWKTRSTPVDFKPNWDWFLTISNGMLYHVYYFIGTNPYLIVLTLGGISSLAIFFIAKKTLKRVHHNQAITNFVIADCLILIAVIFTTYFYPSVIIIESQIIRAGLYILIFSYLYFIGYTVNLYQSNKINPVKFLILTTAGIFSPSPIILPLVLVIQKIFSKKTALILSIFSITLMSAFLFFVSVKLDILRPGIYIYPAPSPLYEIETWAKDNTAKDAVFIIPPHLWWFYTPDWRAISERSTVVTLYDLIEIVFAPEYLPYWKERFQSLVKNTLYKYRGNVFENMKITKQAFYSQPREHFIEQAKKYQASYLLVEKPYIYNFPIKYENRGFILYDLSPFLN